MKRLFSKIAALSVGLAMAVGAGVILGQRNFEKVEATGEVTVTRSDSTALSETAEAIQSDANVTIKTSAANTYTAPCRFYSGTTITIEALNGAKLVSVVYNASSTGNYVTNAQNAAVSPSVTPTVNNKAVTWNLSSSNTDTFTITPSTQTRWNSIAVTYVAGSGPSVSINGSVSLLNVGDTGTFTASSNNATNPSYTWSSDTAAVLDVASNGAYEAKAYGTAKLRVDMTCDEGSAFKVIDVSVNGVDPILVADAVAIAAAFDNSKNTTTSYYVVVTGYVTSTQESLDNSSNPRAFNISDAKVGSTTTSNTIMAYGIYSDNPLRSYAILNGTLTVRTKVQNYNGTLELSSLSVVSYTDDAEQFAKSAYESLNDACSVGPASVTDEQWTTLATNFNALDEYAQAKLAAASTSYPREDVAHWVDRYVRIVNAGKSNFMNSSAVSVLYRPTMINEQNIGFVIVISIIATSAIAFGLFFMLRKRKEK